MCEMSRRHYYPWPGFSFASADGLWEATGTLAHCTQAKQAEVSRCSPVVPNFILKLESRACVCHCNGEAYLSRLTQVKRPTLGSSPRAVLSVFRPGVCFAWRAWSPEALPKCHLPESSKRSSHSLSGSQAGACALRCPGSGPYGNDSCQSAAHTSEEKRGHSGAKCE